MNWGLLGANNYIFGGTSFTESGSPSSASETVTVNFSGFGLGYTFVQCPAAACTLNGTFAPGQVVLANLFGGSTILDFSQSVSGIGFQAMPGVESPVPNDEYIEIGVYDGSTLLANFSSGLFGGPVGADNNTAGFYGVTDLTGAHITSVRLVSFICPAGPGSCSPNTLFINHMLLDLPLSSGPEPASLALLSSGLGLLGFLRRKLAVRK